MSLDEITVQELAHVCREEPEQLETVGGVEKLAQKLQVNVQHGVDESTVASRQVK